MYELLHRVHFIRVWTFAIIVLLIQPSPNLGGSEGDRTVTSDVKVENDHKGNIPAEINARPSRISTTYQQFVEAKENGTEPILPDFSYAGYHYFSEPVPDVAHPIFDVTKYGAIPNDALSDQKAIQASYCSSRGQWKRCYLLSRRVNFSSIQMLIITSLSISTAAILF